jgi:hypothetical protein
MAEPLSKPPLQDPLHEKELFVSEIVGLGVVHNNFAVTLANVRFDEPIGTETPKPHRVVVGRLILTNVAAGQLLQGLQRLVTQIEAAAKTAPTHVKN